MAMNFISHNKASIAVAEADRAAGTADINGEVLDLQGYSGAVAVVEFGAIAAGAVTSLRWQVGDLAAGTDMEDARGTALSIPDDADNEVAVVELVSAHKRYARLVVDRATQNAALLTALYFRTGPRQAPGIAGDHEATFFGG